MEAESDLSLQLFVSEYEKLSFKLRDTRNITSKTQTDSVNGIGTARTTLISVFRVDFDGTRPPEVFTLFEMAQITV